MSNPILCYLGGGRLLSLEMNSSFQAIQSTITQYKLGSVAIIAIPSKDKKRWIEISKEIFSKLGISSMTVCDYEIDTIEEFLAKIENAEILFFTGGYPDKFLTSEIIHKNKRIITEVIKKKKKFVIGTSAGALVMNKICFISPDEEYSQIQELEGLNLSDKFICDVHFSLEREKYLKKLKDNNIIIALEENSSLFFFEDKINTIGNVSIFLPKSRNE